MAGQHQMPTAHNAGTQPRSNTTHHGPTISTNPGSVFHVSSLALTESFTEDPQAGGNVDPCSDADRKQPDGDRRPDRQKPPTPPMRPDSCTWSRDLDSKRSQGTDPRYFATRLHHPTQGQPFNSAACQWCLPARGPHKQPEAPASNAGPAQRSHTPKNHRKPATPKKQETLNSR